MTCGEMVLVVKGGDGNTEDRESEHHVDLVVVVEPSFERNSILRVINL